MIAWRTLRARSLTLFGSSQGISQLDPLSLPQQAAEAAAGVGRRLAGSDNGSWQCYAVLVIALLANYLMSSGTVQSISSNGSTTGLK